MLSYQMLIFFSNVPFTSSDLLSSRTKTCIRSCAMIFDLGHKRRNGRYGGNLTFSQHGVCRCTFCSTSRKTSTIVDTILESLDPLCCSLNLFWAHASTERGFAC